MAIAKSPNRDLLPLFKKLGSEFASFSGRGTLLIQKPIRNLMGGFYFEPLCADRSQRWLSYFVLPLYVPTETVTLNWGDRFPAKLDSKVTSFCFHVTGTAEELERTVSVMRNDGLVSLTPILSLAGFYEFARDKPEHNRGYRSEVLACTAALLGDVAAALHHISEAFLYWEMRDQEAPITGLAPGLADYELPVADRLRSLRSLLQDNDLNGAIAQLDRWQDQTIAAIGIEDLVAAG